ncbi:hypothetical protein QFZ34_002206 [Phyllobacterium ifriqiyense]|uniref:HNH nuclease domain-containing protein n=1 Tax=Phyllobacterium ifriqiyense TaxID=314238 RepID=A0ABU0S8D7_9HYPH|nr:hypothetical protein [Phyllobacterium ifriqiyense]
MIDQSSLDAKVVRELFEFDSERGVLVWRERPREHFKTDRAWKARNSRYAGKDAGHLDKDGYTYIQVLGRRRLAHRLIWLYVHGSMPDGVLDHESGRRSHNRLDNLRTATLIQNGRNRKRPNNNTSGRMGVIWDRSRGRWLAQIRVGPALKHLGRYSDFKEACKAREAAERANGFHINHGRTE